MSQIPQVDPNDTEFEIHTIASVRAVNDGYKLSFSSGRVIHCSLIPDGYLPGAGDEVRLYGKGIGYVVRGIVIAGHVARYLTEEQQVERDKKEREERDQRSRVEYESALPELTRMIQALPEPLQNRIGGFVHEWKSRGMVHQFLPYELETCTAAAKILEWIDAGEGRSAEQFYELPIEEQLKVIPSGLTGNMVGKATRLAHLTKIAPDLVSKEHATACVIVGCQEARCWTVREHA